MTTRSVKKWFEESFELLGCCFEGTDWNTLCEPYGRNIDELTECITHCIIFSVDSIVPTSMVDCYSNKKTWVRRDMMDILNSKKMAVRVGKRDELK